jgi:tRNA dimethylallyltransferase
MMGSETMIGIIGATATGKTQLAVALAFHIKGEILSADSRQVYRQMDIGTGKDLNEYNFKGQAIPYHLIDIANPGEEYNVFRYQEDFDKAYKHVIQSGKTPVLCGGSGMYIDVALGRKYFPKVAKNDTLRNELEGYSMKELTHRLASYGKLHNSTDTKERERCIRAIEIEEFKQNNSYTKPSNKQYQLFGIKLDRNQLRSNITKRLSNRLEVGMIEEVKLLSKSLSHKQLSYYGLEYKYLSQYLCGEISKEKMFTLLNTAIHQFAKRQETWFRRMERQGIHIHWVDGELSLEEKVKRILSQLNY